MVEKPQILKLDVSIVVLGSINPAIFHPSWFVREGILSEIEAEPALQPTEDTGGSIHPQGPPTICTPEVTQFDAGWFRVRVDRNQLIFATSDESNLHPLRDRAKHTMSVLTHTPLRAFGFNYVVECSLSPEMFDRYKHAMTPPDAWQELIDEPELHSVVIDGKRQLQGVRDSSNATQLPEVRSDYIRIHVRMPKPQAPGKRRVIIHTNEHFQSQVMRYESSTDRVDLFNDTLDARWHEFVLYAKTVNDRLNHYVGQAGNDQ